MKHTKLFSKLSCRRGASMLIAILVFFLAVLSGTVALTMAASNAGRFTHEKDDQQAYLSVASAAKIILNRLESLTIKCVSVGQSEPKNVGEVNVTFETPYGDGLFLSDPRFQYNLKHISLGAAGDTKDVDFYLTAPEAVGMGQVYVSHNIAGSTFYFRLWAVNGESHDYQMTLEVTSHFDGKGQNNFTVGDDGFYHREMTFDTEGASYTVERDPTGGKS